LTGLTRRVLQQALEVEMADHLGYDKHEFEGRNGLNSRNGSTPKTVRTEIGEVTVQVPRDRQGTFEPAIVPKCQRRIGGFDEAVTSLDVKGMTTGDFQAHLSGVYGREISRDLVSKVADAVLTEMQAWQERPLAPMYPVILIDAIVMKVPDGQVGNRSVYAGVGIDLDGHRDVLGMWVGPTGGEGRSSGWTC
jgi:putative transposase